MTAELFLKTQCDQLQHFESASRRFQAVVTAHGLMQCVCGNCQVLKISI